MLPELPEVVSEVAGVVEESLEPELSEEPELFESELPEDPELSEPELPEEPESFEEPESPVEPLLSLLSVFIGKSKVPAQLIGVSGADGL